MAPPSALRGAATGRYTKLLDQWQAPEGAGRPVGCIATSFTFDPVFFEEECIARFLRLDTDPNEDGLAYLIEREEKLAEAHVVALVDHRHADPMRSLRWDLLPVRVAAAAQHSKISLLAWERVVRLIVASANLTEPGYRSNLEVFACVDFRDGADTPVDVLRAITAFVRGVLGDYVAGDESEPGPKRRALALLGRIDDLAAGMALGSRRTTFQVVPLFGGAVAGVRHSALSWVKAEAERRGRPRSAVVVSPFFDNNDRQAFRALEEILPLTGDRRVDVVTNGVPIEDGRTRLFVPEWMRALDQGRLQIGLHRTAPEEGDEVRRLHGKVLFLRREDGYSVAVVGSSNFTRAGFGLGAGPINLEANLAYICRDEGGSSRDLRKVIPATEGPLDVAQVVFDPEVDPDADDTLLAILPAGFQEALFRPSPTGGELTLRFGSGLPEDWSVYDPDAGLILDSRTWSAAAKPNEFTHEVTHPRPPSFLDVSWADSSKRKREGDVAPAPRARWAVNVTEQGLLPPPEELRTLPLETLIQILTSARPIHETLVRILRRPQKAPTGDGDPDLDPLRRFRDETHLLYRTRKVAGALEQLKLRLERPVLHEDALKWRLEGPVGPLALARALVEEARSPAEGAFLVAELARTVKSVRVVTHLAGVDASTVRRRLDACVEHLRNEIKPEALGEAHVELRAYIEAVFQEGAP
jgi:hypothetical protein